MKSSEPAIILLNEVRNPGVPGTKSKDFVFNLCLAKYGPLRV